MKKITILMLSLVMIVTFTACGTATTSTGETPETKVVTDSLGREVEVPAKIESIGSLGVMRLLTYMEASDLVKGATDMDNVSELTRPYTYVHPEYKDLAVIGQGGAGGIVPFDEEIIKLEPDVIFVVSDYDGCDELSSKIGIPVVAIANPGLFDSIMNDSIEIIGEVLGKEDRATEINTFMDEAQKDLKDRTKDIESKPTVYNGGLNFRGKHGFDGTSAEYGPFMSINANNVVDQTGQSGAFTVDLEQVLEWNPDIIFLNPENMDLVNEQYKKNPGFFNSLDAVKEGRVYTQLAYNNNYTNVEIALADAYYAGTVIYPEQFKDIDAEKKADEIFKFLLGKEIYSDFVSAGQGFGQLTIGN
ncbi:ABC transporter substrate-binding protein [Alkalibaculum sp. M08DMB]|uniref:ABC transporter substrate-binding protein n=1 Tax=Alkalibaculum sporogenes TaxID=2655001 RepID=A0A6A7K9C1_9FIRM|nr:iron ABC transporter substrate-binding protein [Alkalibaculum sporogenes]MPW25787.1 ABC transporter substrate-binding protein [Alkalibaculum sporogenes]